MIDKPKKERRFLKTLGRVGEILIQEVLIKIGSNLIKKIGGKKTLPSILFLLASLSLFAQYPATGNKQRLGYQTTGDGLVFRGEANDTMTIKSSGLNNAYFILDTVNNVLFNYIKTKGGWQFSNGDTIIINNNFTQPFDSLFFKTSVATNNVDTAKMRWDSDLGTVVLGMYDKVPNELGFKSFWLVKNQTGSTITKGSIVYANGTVGASGRITVAKFIANGSIDAKYLLGITAHDLTDGEDGYVISFGKIRQVNTDTFAAGAILYPSPTVAGVWTDVEPVAPNIDMPIGFCINSHVNNGTIAIRVASGYKLSELHDVQITSPVESSSLYYKGGLWRDTTATLFVSDTASMLTNYLRSGVAASTYLTQSNAASTYLPLAGGTMTGTINRQEGSHDGSASTFYYNILNYFARKDNNKQGQTAQITFTDRPGTNNFPNAVRTSDIYFMTAHNWNGVNYSQYLDTTLSIVANDDGGRIGVSKLNPAYKLDVNGTFNASGNSLIGGTLGVTGATTLGSTLAVTGAITKDGNNVLTNLDTVSLSTRIDLKLNISDTASMLAPYFKDADTTSLNLTSRFAAKLNISDTASMLTNYLRTGVAASTYLPLTGGILSGTLGINAANPLFTKLAVNGDIGLGVFGTPNTSFKIGPQRPDGLGFINTPYINFKTDVSANGLITFSTIHSGVTGYQDAMVINYDGKVGIGTINPLSKLDVNGTLGVTGATTLSAPLTVNSSAVFNEGSTDSDFRVESDGNANMVFVDASTDRVGIGTNAPTKELDVNGELRIGTVSTTPSALLGKNGSNVVGEVTSVNQSGFMYAAKRLGDSTDVAGELIFAHGLSWTPSFVFAQVLYGTNLYINPKSVDATNITLRVYDNDGNAVASTYINAFQWMAIK